LLWLVCSYVRALYPFVRVHFCLFNQLGICSGLIGATLGLPLFPFLPLFFGTRLENSQFLAQSACFLSLSPSLSLLTLRSPGWIFLFSFPWGPLGTPFPEGLWEGSSNYCVTLFPSRLCAGLAPARIVNRFPRRVCSRALPLSFVPAPAFWNLPLEVPCSPPFLKPAGVWPCIFSSFLWLCFPFPPTSFFSPAPWRYSPLNNVPAPCFHFFFL